MLSRRLSGHAPALYVWLRLIADRAGIIRTSAAHLAVELGRRSAMVRSDLRNLEQAGYIRSGRSGGCRALSALVVLR